MDKQYIIVGGGGHALSVADAGSSLALSLLGYTAPGDQGALLPGLNWLGADDTLDTALADTTWLINGLGSVAGTTRRRTVYEALAGAGWRFANLVHPHASLSPRVRSLGAGCQVLAGAVVNAGAALGANVLVNSGAVVEHGCVLGDHVHVASGATLCGDCEIATGVHVGAGATVIQGISIGFGAVIAAGAVVTKNVEPLTLVGGLPGRVLKRFDDQ